MYLKLTDARSMYNIIIYTKLIIICKIRIMLVLSTIMYINQVIVVKLIKINNQLII